MSHIFAGWKSDGWEVGNLDGLVCGSFLTKDTNESSGVL